MKVSSQPVHPMTDTRTVSFLAPAAHVLAVTAASYGLPLPDRVLRWTGAPTAHEPVLAPSGCGLANPGCTTQPQEPVVA